MRKMVIEIETTQIEARYASDDEKKRRLKKNIRLLRTKGGTVLSRERQQKKT